MLLRVFVIVATLAIAGPAGDVWAAEPAPAAVVLVAAGDGTSTATSAPTPPNDTINEFYPEDRSLGDCLSSLPKPGCGSEARGGWHQTLVLLAILAGLGFIVWRIVAQSRKARR